MSKIGKYFIFLGKLFTDREKFRVYFSLVFDEAVQIGIGSLLIVSIVSFFLGAVTSILPGATLTNSWAGVEIPAERFMASDDVAQVIWTAYNLPSTTVLEEIILRPQLGDL